jgi:hypothetical protein
MEKEKTRIAIDNATMKNLSHDEMKYNQGEFHGLHLALVMPENLEVELKEDLERIEANQ